MFKGFKEDQYTRVPDNFFDELLAFLTDAEVRVFLYLIRRTKGFNKDEDAVSFKQFLKGIVKENGERLDYGCGIRNRSTLSKALKSLEEKGIITSRKTTVQGKREKDTTIYKLVYEEAVQQMDYPSTATVPQVVQQMDQQKTVQQKKRDTKSYTEEQREAYFQQFAQENAAHLAFFLQADYRHSDDEPTT